MHLLLPPPRTSGGDPTQARLARVARARVEAPALMRPHGRSELLLLRAAALAASQALVLRAVALATARAPTPR